MRVKKDDTVVVIAGKDKGKKGKVVAVLPKQNRVVVEGVNIMTKHQKPTAVNPQGGIINKEAPIHVSNVKVIETEKKAKTVKTTEKKTTKKTTKKEVGENNE